MSYTRRNFLRNTALAGTGLLLSGSDLFAASGPKPIKNFGLQLYSLRDEMPKNPQGVLKQVAAFGYKQIESYGGPQGIFWGMTNTDFKKFMDDLGMTIVSSHCNWQKDFESLAAQAGEIGMKYLACPYLGAQKTIEEYKQWAKKFNAAGEICRKNGLRFAYHNHAYSFKTLEGQLPQDVMIAETDPALVDFEMDMYWVADAGFNIDDYLKKHKGRFRLCHIKDRMKNADPAADNNSCTLGEGTIDFAKHLKTGQETGIKYFIVEQERYDNTTQMKSAEDNAAYMKKLKV
jgi:sugar phosphate isomerase/epimerase